MKYQLNCRSQACPMPVVETRKKLAVMQDGESIDVAVDNFIAVQNLVKMAGQMRLAASFAKISDEHYVVTLTVQSGQSGQPASAAQPDAAQPLFQPPAAAGADPASFHPPESSANRPQSISAGTINQPGRPAPHEVVVVASDKLGDGDEKLGRILIKGFIYALTEQKNLPQTVLFFNAGVKLAVEGSDSLADLKLLAAQGVEILLCGTCLNYYNLTEKIGVGSITNMYVIVEKISEASKVIRL